MFLYSTGANDSQALFLRPSFSPTLHLYPVGAHDRQPLFLELPRVVGCACLLVPLGRGAMVELPVLADAAEPFWLHPDGEAALGWSQPMFEFGLAHDGEAHVEAAQLPVVFEVSDLPFAEAALGLAEPAGAELGRRLDGNAMMQLFGLPSFTLAVGDQPSAVLDLDEGDCE